MPNELLLFIGFIIFLALIFITVVFIILRRRSANKQANPTPEKKATATKTKQPNSTAEITETSPPIALVAKDKVASAPPKIQKTKKTSVPTASPKKAEKPVSPPPSSTPTPSTPSTPSIPTSTATGDDLNKIRILIVDDNEQTAENVGRLLYFEDDMEVIGQAYNGKQGVEMSIEMKPHVVLMDINMPEMDGIDATKLMSQKNPYSQVIIMSVQADTQYMRRAMAAGARDFQAKPFSVDDLVNCIRRVYTMSIPMYQQLQAPQAGVAQATVQATQATTQQEVLNAPIIAVYSPKGGIGTSAIAVNLAVAWQKAHENIVLMDGDLQFGDVMVHMNTRPKRTIGDLVDFEEIEVEILSQILSTHESGLKMLLAPLKPELAELITDTKVAAILRYLKTLGQAIVVDTASHLNNQVLTILDAADYILVVSSPELTSVKSTKQFLELMQDLELPMDRVGIVINKANVEGGISVDQIKGVLKLKEVFYIPYDAKMQITINRGSSIYAQEGHAELAKAFNVMAEEIWEKVIGSDPAI